MPGAGERRSLLLLARDSNRDMLAANDLVIGRIKSVPARARNVDFRPSMRGAVLLVGLGLTFWPRRQGNERAARPGDKET